MRNKKETEVLSAYAPTKTIMSTLSVPLTPELESHVEKLVDSGYGSNKADVVRRAIKAAAEEQAIQALLKAAEGPFFSGDLDELAKQII